jgi:predicted nuclease of predicted toxin-antitoxin system
MKLLLDQNISHRLIASLIETYPESTHVAYLALRQRKWIQHRDTRC